MKKDSIDLNLVCVYVRGVCGGNMQQYALDCTMNIGCCILSVVISIRFCVSNC